MELDHREFTGKVYTDMNILLEREEYSIVIQTYLRIE